MSTKQYEHSLEAGKYHRRFKGSFTPSGAGVSSASGATRGTDFTPSYVSTGIYRVTLLDDTGAALKYTRLISARFDFQAENAYTQPTIAGPGAASEANGTVDCKIFSTGTQLEGSKTFDPANLADGAGESTDVTVTGAALGDFAVASFSLDNQDIILDAAVTAADTVTVRLQNESTGPINLAEGTLRVRVFPATNGAMALRNVTASGVLRRINFEVIVAVEDIPGAGASA